MTWNRRISRWWSGLSWRRRRLIVGYVVLSIVLFVGNFGTITFLFLFVWLFGWAILLTNRGLTFLIDWVPLVTILFLYEYVRGLADDAERAVNIANLIGWERGLFGRPIPTLRLQAALHPTTQLHWYDYGFGVFHLAFFVFPFVVAFVLWMKSRRDYWLFLVGFLTLTVGGYITYALFPAMPPWLASERGFLPEVARIVIPVMQSFPGINLLSPYAFISANDVAAMPSLHSAWPTFTTLALVLFRGRRMWWFCIWPIVTWFTVIYFGEHYIIDVLAGMTYAVAAFGVMVGVRWLLRRHEKAPVSVPRSES